MSVGDDSSSDLVLQRDDRHKGTVRGHACVVRDVAQMSSSLEGFPTRGSESEVVSHFNILLPVCVAFLLPRLAFKC
jgi:hypothetical protein